MENKESVSATELADLLGVSKKTIAAWATSGVVARTAHGRYDLRASIRGFAKHARERDRGGDVAAVASVAMERAGLLAVQRKRAEHEFEKECGKLIDADEFREAMTVVCRGLKVHFLQIPRRVRGQAAHFTDQDIRLVDEEVRTALSEVSEMSLAQVRAIAAEGVKELAPP
jgi:terminase small subunit / prophage DNA-packing protein